MAPHLRVPVTEWKDPYTKNLWHIKIVNDDTNGLGKVSAVECVDGEQSISGNRPSEQLYTICDPERRAPIHLHNISR
jgi:hypothetical protein